MTEKAASTPTALVQLNGAAKAALWLLSVDEDVAVAALSLLSAEELVRLRKAVESIEKVGPEQLTAIHSEFNRLLEEQPLRVRGNLDYLKQLTAKALGETRAAQLMPAREALPPSAMLMEADPERLAMLLKQEHPQVIAAVLTTLSAKRASDVMMLFEEELRKNVVGRLAKLTKVPQASLARAQQVLSAGLPAEGGQEYTVDGVRLAASLLNQLQTEMVDGILAGFATPELAEDVRQAMFTFEDLARLDKRGMQSLLKEVPSDQLILSLKGAPEQLKEKIFDSLSKRAADMMREDLQLMGPVRLAEVEKAQETIVGIALRLRSEGKITVMGGGGDFV